MGASRFGMAALAASLFSLGTVAESEAASVICKQLQSQLATAGRGGGGSAKVERTIARQRQELAKANTQLRNAQCGLFSAGGQCGAIKSTIRRMEANLADLQGRRGGGGQSRAQIRAALDANNCNAKPQRELMARDDNRPSLFSSFFGATPRRNTNEQDRFQRRLDELNREPAWVRRLAEERRSEYSDRSAEERQRNAAAARQGVGAIYGSGTFQTMCVRTTDGYYFPISPSSTRSDFSRDSNNCQAMCPGEEIKLFYKELDDDDVDAMTDARSGQSYRALPTAYKYREQPTRGCSGDRTAALAAAEKARNQEYAANFEFPIPAPKPDSDNTIPAWIGSFKVETAPPGERAVRVVGPQYLPDQSTAEGQPVQVPILAR